jgi:hypothetical protein
MAVEKNNEIVEEEARVTDEVVEQPEGSGPIDISVEGEEEIETRPEDDFNANLAENMDERTLQSMASDLVAEYKKDKTSRKEWEDAYIKGLELLGTKYQEVTKPFKGASGVTHPLLAESVTQFQAQAYKELIPSDGPVRTKVVGVQTPQIEAQADRVKEYMNFLLMEEMEEYTTDMDQMLFYLPLSGSTFKKIYYDEILGRPCAKFIPAEDLIVPYYASDLKDCERITHVIKMTENDVNKKMAAGFYRDIDLGRPRENTDQVQQKVDELQGVKRTDSDHLHTILEMHVDLNLDDYEDFDDKAKKIKIPYVVTIDEGSSESTEPSTTLFNLLGFVVQAGQKFAAITDSGVGNDTQNRAVGTTIALMERGSRVMSGVHKRCYYAMRLEFKILAKICQESLPPEYPYDVYGGPRNIKQSDFDQRVDILPVADPNIMSMAQRVTLAQTQLQIAQSNPQLHNIHEAYRRVYEALGTKQIEGLLKPAPKQPEPMDPAKENARALQMQLLTAFEFQDHDAHIAAHSAFMASRMVQINPQVYALMQSHISDHISFKAKAQAKAMMAEDPQMQMMMQQDPEQFDIMFQAEVAKIAAQITQELVQTEMQQNAAKQDPLVRIKQQEIDLRAMDLQRKAEETQFKQEQENQRAADRLGFDYDRLVTQDQQSDERLQIARQKLEKK